MDVPATPKGIMALVGRKRSKNIKFLDEDVVITKLTVAQVKQIQTAAQALEKDEGNDESGLEVLRTVIRASVVGAEGLQDEDFEGWPIDDLRNLSREIMKFSGIAAEDEGK
jgi:hypothetical protein